MPHPDRVLLTGVPRVRFHEGGPRCPEDIPLPACVRACLEYLGDPRFGCRHESGCQPGCLATCSYAYAIGVSGAASFLAWGPGWRADNLDIRRSSDDPDVAFREALAGVGYACEVLRTASHDEAACRARVLESLAVHRRPVIALGVAGPPVSSLVTGYDEQGDVLIGWSFFQEMPPFRNGLEYEPSGEFRARNWYGGSEAFVVIGEPLPDFDFRAAHRRALHRMVSIARRPPAPGRVPAGLAAYAAWVEALLEDDGQLEDGDEAALRTRFAVHDSTVGYLAECRWYGAQFLLQASDDRATHYRLAEHLLRAAACYAAEHALMWDAWGLTGGLGHPEGYRRLADVKVRRGLAEVILRARDLDAEATSHIEAALARPEA